MKKMIIMTIMAFVMMFSGVNTNTNCDLVGMKQKHRWTYVNVVDHSKREINRTLFRKMGIMR